MAIVVETISPQGTRTRACPTGQVASRPRRGTVQLRPLDQERQSLAGNATRLAYHRAHEARRKTQLPLSDLIAVALRAVCEAASRWDEARAPFGPYASMVIRHQLAAHAEQERTRQERFPTLDIGDQVEDHQEPPRFSPEEARELVDKLRRFLRPDEFTLLWQRYGQETPLRALACVRRVSRARVHQLVNRALDRARRVLKAE